MGDVSVLGRFIDYSQGEPPVAPKRQAEKSKKRLSRLAWKSRPPRGIPTFPLPRRRLAIKPKPDISLATKTGHFNLLPTFIEQAVYLPIYSHKALPNRKDTYKLFAVV